MILFRNIRVFIVMIALAGAAQANTPQTIQKLLAQGKHAQALVHAQGLMQIHPFDAYVLRIRAEIEMGNLTQAELSVNAALLQFPKASVLYFQKAIIMARLGNTAHAGFLYRRALDLAQTDHDRGVVRNALRAHRAAQQLKFSGGVGIAPTTNANRATGKETTVELNLFGTTINATPSEVEESGIGLQAWGGVQYVTRPRGPLQFDISAKASGNFYNDREFTQNTTTLGFGGRYAVGPGVLQSLQFSLHSEFANYDLSARTRKLEFTHQTGTQATGNHRYVASFGKTVFVNENEYDEKSIAYHRVFARRGLSTFGFGITQSERDSDSDSLAYDRTGAYVSWQRGFARSGFELSTRIETALSRWKMHEPFFPDKKRRLFDRGITISGRNPNISYFGMTPVIQYKYFRRDANIELYGFDTHDVFLGFSNAF